MGGLKFPGQEAKISIQMTQDTQHAIQEVPPIEPAPEMPAQTAISQPGSQETVLSSDGDIGLMFMPSQPMASQKFLGLPTPESHYHDVLSVAEAPEGDDDIDADTLFLPLSFKEYGYQQCQ